MVDAAARYQAHPSPGSVAELESLYSWLEAQRGAWLEYPDAVAAWHRKHLDVALVLVYRELVTRAPKSNNYGAAVVARSAAAPDPELVALAPVRCGDPICPEVHVDGHHLVSAR